MFGDSLYWGDEIVGLFAITAIENSALQWCWVSFELVDLRTRLAVMEVTWPWTIWVVASATSTSTSSCASATASDVHRFNQNWLYVRHYYWWIRVFDLTYVGTLGAGAEWACCLFGTATTLTRRINHARFLISLTIDCADYEHANIKQYWNQD